MIFSKNFDKRNLESKNTIKVYQEPVKIVLNPKVGAKILMFWITFSNIISYDNRFNRIDFSEPRIFIAQLLLDQK